CYQAATTAGVLNPEHREALKAELEAIQPMPAAVEKRYVSRLDGPNGKPGANKMELAEQLIDDIERFREEQRCERTVMVWCGSTEIHQKATEVHQSVEAFEKGLATSDPEIAPSQIYAYAALKTRTPFANGAPNLTVDIPAM